MKKLLLGLIVPAILIGCTGDLESRMDDIETRVSKLETLCNQMNNNISSLQTIVSALQNNDYVTSVTSKSDGYTINFSKSGPVNIYHGKDGVNGKDGKDGKDGLNGTDGKDGVNGKDGKDGLNGKDGQTPVIGVRKDTDGLYYWTLNGEWLLDDAGKKIRAIGTDGADGQDGINGTNGTNGTDGVDGITPQLKIVDGYWQISYDNGATWSQIGKATGDNGADGDSFFRSVNVTDNEVVLILADGTEIALPIGSGMVGQIKSVRYVPGFSDNIAYIYCKETEKTLTMDFQVNPANLAAQIAESWETLLTLDVVYNVFTGTRAVQSTALDITSVIANEGYLEVTASADKLANTFFEKAIGASACLRIEKDGETICSEYVQLAPVDIRSMDLSRDGTANSYIVSNYGFYKFAAVQGNSSESVGDVNSVEVLWESFGTDIAPEVGDLISNVEYSDGYISFETARIFKEGNALIAAKDASGKILWSWHIWLTDEPEEQYYYHGAGIMMDRNLGATSATPGDVGALGLLYQWGRKDPFLGGSAIRYSYSQSTNQAKAASTLTWPEPVVSDATNGTITYTQANPTTFITRNSSNDDWYYTGSSSTDNTRWQSAKTIYDPCPLGWRVPDGHDEGVWTKAGSGTSYFENYPFDSTNKGMDFSGTFGDSSMIWYPFAGNLNGYNGKLNGVGEISYNWSVTPFWENRGVVFESSSRGLVIERALGRAYGYSVRCCRESSEMIPY